MHGQTWPPDCGSRHPPQRPWVKASRSGDNGGDCVEMRRHVGTVEVRDTKDGGTGPTLRFTSAEFAAWLDGAKRGEVDHLVQY